MRWHDIRYVRVTAWSAVWPLSLLPLFSSLPPCSLLYLFLAISPFSCSVSRSRPPHCCGADCLDQGSWPPAAQGAQLDQISHQLQIKLDSPFTSLPDHNACHADASCWSAPFPARMPAILPATRPRLPGRRSGFCSPACMPFGSPLARPSEPGLRALSVPGAPAA